MGRRLLMGSGRQSGNWMLSSGGVVAALDLDFVNDRAWNGSSVSIASLLSCTRASTGYYTKADGTLQSFGNNVLRYGTNGLLVEEGRTNLALRSQEFNNAAWSVGQGTISADATTAPDGTSTADKFVEDNAVGSQKRTFQAGITTATAAHTFSVYLKPAGRTFAHLRMETNGGASNVGAAIDLTNGATSAGFYDGVTAATAFTTLSVETLANGWFRIRGTFTATTSVNAFIYASNSATDTSYAGDGVSGIHLWGAQLEAGAFASSYIPTTTVSVARAADNDQIASGAWRVDGTGTLYCQFGGSQATTNNPRLVGNTLGNPTLLDFVGATRLLETFNAAVALNTANAFAPGATAKGAHAYNAAGRALCLNGGTVATDANLVGISDDFTWFFGSEQGAGNFLNGYIKRVAYWQTKLTNVAIQTLTT